MSSQSSAINCSSRAMVCFGMVPVYGMVYGINRVAA